MRSFCIEETFQESHLKIFKARIKKMTLSFKLLEIQEFFHLVVGRESKCEVSNRKWRGDIYAAFSVARFSLKIFLYKFLDCLHATGESNEYLPSNSCVISPLLWNLKVLFESILRLMVFFIYCSWHWGFILCDFLG